MRECRSGPGGERNDDSGQEFTKHYNLERESIPIEPTTVDGDCMTSATATDRHFSLAPSSPLAPFLAALEEQFGCLVEPPQEVIRTYYDSFDWRLLDGGGRLWHEQEGRESRLFWSGSVQIEWRQRGAVPRFSWDFPHNAMRSMIAPLLEMRALLPQVKLHLTRHIIRILDQEQKTVVRICLEENRVAVPHGEEGSVLPLAVRLEILPLRGYQEESAALHRWLTTLPYLHKSAPDLLEEALAVTGEVAGSYSPKLHFHFTPEMSARQAACEIHRFLLAVMESNLAGVQGDIDSEFLHDFRVAMRRTRSALGQIKGVFDPERVAHFAQRFAWLGQITGPTRDMDVYLLGYCDYRDRLPKPLRSDLDPLRDFLIAHQRQEQRQLAKQLEGSEFQQLLTEWRDFLTHEASHDGGPTLGEVVDRRIDRLYRKVIKEGKAINDHTPAEALHELRKRCKKLRYMMEFFQSLYPAPEISRLIREIKRLLDHLGEHQDLEVQAEKLRHFAHQMAAEGEVSADTFLAMGMLVGDLLRQQQQKREDFYQQFSSFAERRNRRLLNDLVTRRGELT